MVVPFSAKAREPVPDDTIKAFWDMYRHDNWVTNFGTAKNGGRYLGDIDGIAKFNSEYKWKPRDCNRFGRHCEDKSIYSSGQVPIGAWSTVYNKNCSTGGIMDDIYYGGPNHNGTQFPQRLSDDISTNCAGGSGYTHDFVDYKNKIPTTIKPHPYKVNSGDTDKCFIGNKHTDRQDLEDCIVSGVHYPTFCQLGDYVETQDSCKKQCKGIGSTDATPTFCHYAKDRLCGKQTGHPLKKNDFNQVVDSEKNWITEPVCTEYCGPPGQKGSTLCQKHKKDYCLNQDNWPDAAEYCYSYWENNPNTLEMTQVCGNKLTELGDPENITTGKGCGYLCRGDGLDVHDNMCKTKRLEYCTADPEHMETEYCYQFCKDNPDLCESFLHNYCKDKGEMLDQTVGDTVRKYSDYCGCMMGTQFYEDYVKNVFDQFDEGGYNINGASNIKTSPECIFPKCKGGSILTSAQRENIKDCGASCIQVMLNNFVDSSLVGDFMASQSANCTNIEKKTITPPATSSEEPPPATSAAASSSEPTGGRASDFDGAPITLGEPPPLIDLGLPGLGSSEPASTDKPVLDMAGQIGVGVGCFIVVGIIIFIIVMAKMPVSGA